MELAPVSLNGIVIAVQFLECTVVLCGVMWCGVVCWCGVVLLDFVLGMREPRRQHVTTVRFCFCE